MVHKNRDSSPSPSSDCRKRRFFSKKSKSLPLSLAAQKQEQELAKNSLRQDDRKQKHDVSFGDEKNCLTVSVVEFPNDEFCSSDTSLRKKIWYSSLEIRAIKQANMDLVAKAIMGDEEQQSNTGCIQDSDLRGLEHLVEGETKRRERINEFIHSVCKVQQQEKGKGTKPDAVADAISIFSKALTKMDRRQAAKVGKLDAVEVVDEEMGRSGNNSLLPRRSFSSSRRSSNTSSSTSALLPRTKSGHSFHKRRTLIRRMSHRASWITGGSSLLRSTSGSSTLSLQSTTSSTGSANSNNSFATS